MATHDYVIANGTGAAVRSDLNNALAAIVSNNSSSSEPSTTYAYQWWADTNANVLKIRNSANNAWITLRELDGTMLIEDGSASTPGLAFADDTNTGLFSPAADNIALTTGGGERLRINSTESVFNEDSNSYDFRVESNGQTHMLFVDGSADVVGIGTSTPNDFKQGAQTLVVGTGSGANGMSIFSATDASGRICFADGTGAGDEERGQILYAHDDNSMQFSTNAGERVRILSGGGITFNGDTATANALDDYEEGTWTPSLECTGQVGSFTMPVQQGFYTKIGRVVHLQFRITWSAIPSTGGHLSLKGFPFAYPATTGQGEFGAGVAYKTGLNSNSYVSMLGSTTGGGSRTAVKFWDDAQTAINVTTGNNISSSGDVRGSLTYMV